MRAAVQTAYGGPEVVRLAEVELPVAGPRDLLIRVHATTVNRTDAAYRAGTPAFMRLMARARGRILGTEYAGVVEAAGAEVTGYAVGDRVFGYNEGPFGAHAEYLAVRADGFLIPAGLTFAEAAPGTEGAHYAQSFVRRARIRPGQAVLVHGATGAIGSAAVQLMAAMDVAVTATCSTPHVELVRSLGAGRVIDHTAGDFARAAGGGYDAVLDAVGKTTFFHCRRLLRPGGAFSSSDLGPFAQNLGLALVTPLLRRHRVVFAVPLQKREMIEELRDLMAAGRFRPVIDRHYPLDEIVEAYRYVDTGAKLGNVVIDVVPPAPPS